MHRLHIAVATTSKTEPQALSLTPNFSASLRTALTGGDSEKPFGLATVNPAGNAVDIAFLDEYARSQWEGILHYVVNSVADGTDQGAHVSDDVKQLLTVGHLVDRRYKSSVSITQAGFTFLLQEVNAQVWTLLLVWLENADTMANEAMNVNNVGLLSFLFTLGSLELGLAYSMSALTPEQRIMLSHLSAFGLVYVTANDTESFYPTRLATTLTSDASALRTISAGFATAAAPSSASKGFIVIETNYRLYAYTTSPLQIAVLALFAKLKTRYPNMVAGRVTRESIRRAIDQGIQSDQIISYLQTHAHPQMRKKNPILPPTVVDQIRLWQIENERMQPSPGFLFKDFSSKKDYESCAQYADEIGVLIYKNNQKVQFMVTQVEQLRDFIKSKKIK